MSFKLVTEVWRLKLTPTEQHILMAMADYADDDGRNCFPSQPRLAWKTGCHESTIGRTIDKFIARGILQVLRPATNKAPARYQICLDMAEIKPPYRSENEDFRDSTVLPQSESRDGTVLPQDSLGWRSATSRDSTVQARDSTVLPDPIINQSTNQPGKNESFLSPEQWATCVTELAPQHARFAEWLPGSELLPTGELREGKRVCRLVVVNPRSVDWLRRQGTRAICSALQVMAGAPVALEVCTELGAAP